VGFEREQELLMAGEIDLASWSVEMPLEKARRLSKK
jgi:hypothetical protein